MASNVKGKTVNGNTVLVDSSYSVVQAHFGGHGGTTEMTKRIRCTVAQVNAGITLLAALPNFAYRLADAFAISVGGSAGAVTTVDILATQAAGSVKLLAFGQANLTQSAVLKAGGTGATVLADGASFVVNDVNTAITANITGSAITTATHIDFILRYAIEAA